MDLIERAGQRLQKQDQKTAPGHATTVERAGSLRMSDSAEAGTPPPLGLGGELLAIDESRLSAKGVLMPGQGRTQMVEEFRHIKRHVLMDLLDPKRDFANLVMVTSALPGEGKTHIAMNLAMSLALEPDWNVLLIDGDIVNPQVLRRFGVRSEAGLMDYLDDPSVEIADVVLETNIEGLSIITSGQNLPRSTELLSSQRMVQFIEDLRVRFPDHIIIIDTPPLLATTEPAIFARYVGQILLVVESERTRHSSIEAALELLSENEKTRFVLNKMRPQFGDGAYRPYYNYYKYGYGN